MPDFRAGCPVCNIQQTIDGLVDVGLSVCVYEEAPGAIAKGAKLKSRYLARILTPESSMF